MAPVLAAALDLARLRHLAIADGDSDRYGELESDFAACCAALTGGNSALGIDDIPVLDELIALETQSRWLLENLMAETSTRMESLRASARANGAYARSERFSVNGL